MYVLQDDLITYWNRSKTDLIIKQGFLNSLGLDPGEYKFIKNCAFTWENKASPCIAMGWEDYAELDCKIVMITYNDYKDWFLGKDRKSNKLSIKEKEPLKEDKNVNRLQKQKTQIDRGDLPEGNRIKGRACKVTIGIGHLSYQAVKS